MAYDPGAIDAALAAAVGDDPALVAELRDALRESAQAGLTAIRAAGSDADAWVAAAMRLKGLAASFGAIRMMALAIEAGKAPPGDAGVLKRLARVIERL